MMDLPTAIANLTAANQALASAQNAVTFAEAQMQTDLAAVQAAQPLPSDNGTISAWAVSFTAGQPPAGMWSDTTVPAPTDATNAAEGRLKYTPRVMPSLLAAVETAQSNVQSAQGAVMAAAAAVLATEALRLAGVLNSKSTEVFQALAAVKSAVTTAPGLGVSLDPSVYPAATSDRTMGALTQSAAAQWASWFAALQSNPNAPSPFASIT